ncbi:predicted protein [Nematostella vectensis]|uniref:Uncharacterized protein n=1 Tax=Nematostella vectensis TaxID=45351 RepID=A7RWM2_NEMVE|nr:predicted protein [Nematostella vectensis]|eukprot:XP_001636253.1 predicted protein [Nematostella vectensis]
MCEKILPSLFRIIGLLAKREIREKAISYFRQLLDTHVSRVPTRNSHVRPLKHFANRAVDSIKSELDKFADWVLSYVPEPVKKTVDKRVKRLKEKIKRIPEETEGRFTPKEQRTALKGYLKTHGIAGQEGYDPKTFIANIKPKVLKLIDRQKKPIKVKFIFTCRFIKEDPATGQIGEELGYFHTEKPETVTESADFSSLFDTMANYLLELAEQFQKKGSGWQFDQVEYFDINIDPLEPLSGSSYIPLPSKLATKHACFDGDISPSELVRYTAESPDEDIPQLFVESLESDIKKIYDKFRFPKKVVVDSFTNKKGNKINVKRDIRFIDSFDSLDSLVGNMSRECFKNLAKCLNSFRCKQSLEKHSECCDNHEAVRIEMPKIDKDGNLPHIKFKNYNRKMRVPFVVYADFESFTENIDTCSPDGSKSFTKQYQKHKPSGFCYLIKCFD